MLTSQYLDLQIGKAQFELPMDDKAYQAHPEEN